MPSSGQTPRRIVLFALSALTLVPAQGNAEPRLEDGLCAPRRVIPRIVYQTSAARSVEVQHRNSVRRINDFFNQHRMDMPDNWIPRTHLGGVTNRIPGEANIARSLEGLATSHPESFAQLDPEIRRRYGLYREDWIPKKNPSIPSMAEKRKARLSRVSKKPRQLQLKQIPFGTPEYAELDLRIRREFELNRPIPKTWETTSRPNLLIQDMLKFVSENRRLPKPGSPGEAALSEEFTQFATDPDFIAKLKARALKAADPALEILLSPYLQPLPVNANQFVTKLNELFTATGHAPRRFSGPEQPWRERMLKLPRNSVGYSKLRLELRRQIEKGREIFDPVSQEERMKLLSRDIWEYLERGTFPQRGVDGEDALREEFDLFRNDPVLRTELKMDQRPLPPQK